MRPHVRVVGGTWWPSVFSGGCLGSALEVGKLKVKLLLLLLWRGASLGWFGHLVRTQPWGGWRDNMPLLVWEHLRIPPAGKGLRGSERILGYHLSNLTLIPIPPWLRGESSVGAAAALYMRAAPRFHGQKSFQTPHASHVRDDVIKPFISAKVTRGQAMLMKSLHFHFRHLSAAKIMTVSQRCK